MSLLAYHLQVPLNVVAGAKKGARDNAMRLQYSLLCKHIKFIALGFATCALLCRVVVEGGFLTPRQGVFCSRRGWFQHRKTGGSNDAHRGHKTTRDGLKADFITQLGMLLEAETISFSSMITEK